MTTDTEGETQFWREFIQMYKENPCLWDKNCEDYHNQSKKNLAYGILIEKLWDIDGRADLETVKNKIDSFHSSHKIEMNKVMRGKRKFYDSDWCYFDCLNFLTSQELSSEAYVDTNDNTDSSDPIGIENTHSSEPSQSNPTKTNEKADNSNSGYTKCNTGKENGVQPPDKKRKLSTSTIDEESQDDAETFAEHIKARMRNLKSPLQKVIAIKLISDVMFLADTGQLEVTTAVVQRKVPDDRGGQ